MLKFSIKLDYMDFLRFNLTNTFIKKAAIISLAVTIICLFLGVTSGTYTSQERIYMYIIGAFALLWLPSFLMYKSSQAAKSPTFAKPLEYEFSEDGFKISQNYNHREYSWADIASVCDTKHLIVINTNNKEGYIIPKEKIYGKYRTLVDIINSGLSEDKKIKI